ncbi:uncharacterized protein DUF4129 [Actinocorallia herbida]|uniref:Uncharacterized protein DUF4129 n=1 Tax=Actinocorallia herbida TaxID=58109 RepID=A0A3N1D8V4_9ACTN|nr:DUF4129 domain-containing protein [Actinocorallia herbida]ROO89974.1 uncharacterized protein DUF4129 [Actinocorallia herbida]
MSAADPVTREQARELAERELEKAVYHRDRPSFLDKMLDQIKEWLEDILPDPPSPGPGHGGGGLTLVILVVLAAVVVAAVLWWMRGRKNPSAKKALLEDVPTRAVDHRSAAERMAAEGRFAEAIRERLRAIARDLEERAILLPRPGRTALELAVEASSALPVDLMPGARVFDEVWYGDRPGTPEGYALLVALDDAVRAARPRPLEAV